MSATPIPRTLMLTAYGDLDVSRLTEKPPGRQPVDTRTVPLDRAEEVTGAIARALKRGAKVFWVCPMVEESENADIAAAEERYRALARAAAGPGRAGARPHEERRQGPRDGRLSPTGRRSICWSRRR